MPQMSQTMEKWQHAESWATKKICEIREFPVAEMKVAIFGNWMSSEGLFSKGFHF